MKNLRILATSVGKWVKGDIVPAYALNAANPQWLADERHAEWTDDPATVQVTTEALATAAPDASEELIKAHVKLKADYKEATDSLAALHAKCLDLESKHKAVTSELTAKVEELGSVKAARDKLAVELEEMKAIADHATKPVDPKPTEPKPEVK